jgi:hypothetical protein
MGKKEADFRVWESLIHKMKIKKNEIHEMKNKKKWIILNVQYNF